MIDEAHERLIQDVLDGAASPAEIARLNELTARDPEIRARYRELEELFQTLHRVELEDPPSDFAAGVMGAIAAPHERPQPLHDGGTRWAARASGPRRGHGVSARQPIHQRRTYHMSSSRVWVIVVAIALVAGLGYLGMSRRAPGNTEATIGAAQKYAAGQMENKDVTLQNPELSAFMQSDLFHTLATNPDFRKLVTSEKFAAVTGDAAARQTLAKACAASADLASAIKTMDAKGAYTLDKAKIASMDASVRQLLENKAFQSAMSDAATKAAFTSVLANKDAIEFLKSPNFETLAASGKLESTFKAPE